MTTYEHGRAPADAPVTWERYEGGRFVAVFRVSNRAEMATAVTLVAAESICRAFHLAALVDEAAGMLGGAPLTPPGTTDWLRRYRAAKGER